MADGSTRCQKKAEYNRHPIWCRATFPGSRPGYLLLVVKRVCYCARAAVLSWHRAQHHGNHSRRIEEVTRAECLYRPGCQQSPLQLRSRRPSLARGRQQLPRQPRRRQPTRHLCMCGRRCGERNIRWRDRRGSSRRASERRNWGRSGVLPRRWGRGHNRYYRWSRSLWP